MRDGGKIASVVAPGSSRGLEARSVTVPVPGMTSVVFLRRAHVFAGDERPGW
jgi:hypothetical protein